MDGETNKTLRLSDEAISLFFSRGGFVDADPVDLRPLWKSERSDAVNRAAERWNVPPAQVIV